MGLLNFCVYCASPRRTVLHWRIADCSLPTTTFKQFYDEHVVGCDYLQYVLKQAFVGHTKESLDLVDYDLSVAEVVSVFGRYVKYTVELQQATQVQTEHSMNTVEVLCREL